MKVALLGFGVVGKGVYEIIQNDFPDIKIQSILVKHKEKHKDIKSLLVESYDDILNDEAIEVIIECISSKAFAYQAIKQALNHHKHVVTANKAVISDYFKELTQLAKANQVSLLYEASVGAAIIVLDPIKTIAKVNHIHKIEGILNGSTNYILSRIFIDDVSIENAIQEANDLGYLETGSDDDMSGLDPMRKINILSMLSHHTSINEADIIRIPLSSLNHALIDYVKNKGLTIKYVAKSVRIDFELFIVVEPVVMDQKSLISNINFEENIINIYGKYHKMQSFIGQGAGRFPTAQAMVYDLMKIIDQKDSFSDQGLSFNDSFNISQDHEGLFLIQNNQGKIEKIKSQYRVLLDRNDIQSFVSVKEEIYESI